MRKWIFVVLVMAMVILTSCKGEDKALSETEEDVSGGLDQTDILVDEVIEEPQTDMESEAISFDENEADFAYEALGFEVRVDGSSVDPKVLFETYLLSEGNDVHIKASGLTLKDGIITGDLYVEETVGSGEFYLENIQVVGDIFVHGGGPNSGYFINVSGKNLIIESETNPHIVLDVNTALEGVQLASDCHVHCEGDKVKGVTVNNPDTEAAINVLLQGEYPQVSIESTANVTIDGNVSLMQVLQSAGMTSIEMVDDSKMYFYACNGQSVRVHGGVIIEAWINAEYCSLPEDTESINSEIGVAEVIVGDVSYQLPEHIVAEEDNSDQDTDDGQETPDESEETSTDNEPEDDESTDGQTTGADSTDGEHTDQENDHSEAAQADESAEETEDDETNEPEDISEEQSVLATGYPAVTINGNLIRVSVLANEPCTVYAMVDAAQVFALGTTPEKVKAGHSAGIGMDMGDGMSYIVIHASFEVTQLGELQNFTIDMNDYMSDGMNEGNMGDDSGPPDGDNSVGVFVVVEDAVGQLSQVYSFQ